MTTPLLIDDIKRDEGCVLTAYQDTVGVWTIGYGHTGRDIHPGLTWTLTQADATLASDVFRTCKGLDSALPWWRKLDDVRQDVLANMAFNMGVAGLLGFHNTLAFVEAANYAAASGGMLASKWATQVGARATRLAAIMKTGTIP